MTAPIDLDALDAAMARRAPGGWREMDGDVPGDARAIVAAIAAAPQLVALARAVVAYADAERACEAARNAWHETTRRSRESGVKGREYESAMNARDTARDVMLTLAAGFTANTRNDHGKE
jgi:hypothetical protein